MLKKYDINKVLHNILLYSVLGVYGLILNTIGGLLGILIFKIMYFFLKEKTRMAIEILAPVAGVGAVLILTLSNAISF